MNETIAQADNLEPRDFGVSRAFLFWDPAGRFSDNFKQPHQRQIQQPIRIEVCACPAPRERGRFSGVIEHVAHGRNAVTLAHTESPPRLSPDRESTDLRTVAWLEPLCGPEFQRVPT